MSRTHKIIYWVATIWLSLGMVSTGVVQLVEMEDEVRKMSALGYPRFFLPLIGTSKLLGVVAVLVPGFPLLKEWAYAGFFFLMSGAIFTQLMVNNSAVEYFGPALLLVLTITSWYLRPESRRIGLVSKWN